MIVMLVLGNGRQIISSKLNRHTAGVAHDIIDRNQGGTRNDLIDLKWPYNTMSVNHSQ